MRPPNARPIEEWAVFFHGVTAALHFVMLVHNLRRGNRFDSVAHALGVVYDARATATHVRALRANPTPSGAL